MAEERNAREMLALALDAPNGAEALRLARELSEWFGVVKVGLELFAAEGPRVVSALREAGLGVFVDLKLHDIPNTVNKAAFGLGRLGAAYTTLHAAGGLEMLAAGVAGLREGALAVGEPAPRALAVTVLTSSTPDGQHQQLLAERAQLAAQSECAGVVCAAADLETINAAAGGLLKVVPGVRPAGSQANDQARVATPAEAIAAGADLLVVGRAVTTATDPAAAANTISTEVQAALSAS